MPQRQSPTSKKKASIKSPNTKKTITKPSSASRTSLTEKKIRSSDQKTRVIIQYDAGYKNSLFVRGEGGPNLSWDKGVELKNIKADEWIWETNRPFSNCQFKILINDKTFEVGENHTLTSGTSVRINPKFPTP